MIVRTPTQATGGITDAERIAMEAISREWIDIALSTRPANRAELTRAIHDLYAAAGLKRPRVVLAPSPLAMTLAYGASAAIWYLRDTRAATRAATDAATRAATLAATRAATDAATDAATRAATDFATDAATEAATDAATRVATDFALKRSARWTSVCQGGAYWAWIGATYCAFRDVLGLDLPQFDSYERAARHGTFRVMHPEFCIVSDFPEILKIDQNNRPHAENGPSHRWRDGWSLYHWHGVRVPPHWIENRHNLNPGEVLTDDNVERRAAGCAIIGWPKMLGLLQAKTIDKHADPAIGELIEVTLPGLPEPGRFLKAECPRNGAICEGVPHVSDIDGLPINTAIAAQAYRLGDPQSDYQPPKRRT